MAMTLRLPPALQAEAAAHAETLGLSINALVALSLREHLLRERGRTFGRTKPSAAASVEPAPSASPPPAAAATPTLPPATVTSTWRAPKSRADPCPCGARDRVGHPLKWKHCHGRASAS
jgi:hypothetical protein